jgi:hypothetical protein
VLNRVAIAVNPGAVDVLDIRAGQTMKFKSHKVSPFAYSLPQGRQHGRPETCGKIR